MSTSKNVGLFGENIGLFWENVGLFWENVGLFWESVYLHVTWRVLPSHKLFWENVGLFWENIGLFWENVGLFLVTWRVLPSHKLLNLSEGRTAVSWGSCMPENLQSYSHHSKEPYILSKEPYILSKEPYILSKSPKLSQKSHTPTTHTLSIADRCFIGHVSRAPLYEYTDILAPYIDTDTDILHTHSTAAIFYRSCLKGTSSIGKKKSHKKKISKVSSVLNFYREDVCYYKEKGSIWYVGCENVHIWYVGCENVYIFHVGCEKTFVTIKRMCLYDM